VMLDSIPLPATAVDRHGDVSLGGRLRIGFVDVVLDPGKPTASGLSDIVWNMAREFARVGDDVHIVGPYLVEQEPSPGITIHRFPIPPIGYRNIAGRALLILRAWKKLKSIPGIDVIHAPEYLSTGIIAPRSSVPVIMTTPGNIYERIKYGNPFDWSTTQALKLAARSSARSCTLINAISTDMAWWWERTGAPSDRVVVIPLGVDTEIFRPIQGARSRLGLSAEPPILLYVGRLSPEKQVDVLFRALTRLEASIPYHLHVVGSGPSEASLRQLVGVLGLTERATFHGQRPMAELPLWYSAADAVVLPSRSEGLPRVMLEAMSCGAPFIGTVISGVRDHIIDGKNGFIVPPGDEDELAKRLDVVLRQPSVARSVGSCGRDYVEKTLTWPIVVGAVRAAIVQRLEIDGRRAHTPSNGRGPVGG
jgi:glycosyltransferase involved in cell wall biosynthesis